MLRELEDNPLLNLPRSVMIPATIGILIVAYTVGSIFYNLFLSPLRHLPGPKLWAISKIPSAYKHVSGVGHKRMAELHRKYGPVVRIAPNQVSFNDGRYWKDAMGHRKGGIGMPAKDPIFYHDAGNGILGSSGSTHANQRRILAHEFSAQAMNEQQPLINTHIDLLFKHLKNRCNNGTAPIDINMWFTWCAFDIISDLSFGKPFGSLKQEDWHPWVRAIKPAIHQLNFMAQIRRVWPASAEIAPTLMKVIFGNEFRSVEGFVGEMIAERKALRHERPDFMRSMLEKNGEEDFKMTDEQVEVNATTLVVAGAESIATAMLGTTFLLAKNQDKFAALSHEIRGAFSSEDEITMMAVQKLPYLSAAINEGLRMFPPTGEDLPRVVRPEGDVICGTPLPGGTVIGAWQYVLFRDPDHFAMPDSYMPERWLEGNNDPRFANDKKDALQPFGFGPRACIGKNLAFAEMRLIIARMAYNFDITLVEDSKRWMEDMRILQVWAEPPLNLYLKPRNI